ncbi:MAG: DUF4416 family protein [Candidatus Omnitrophica bacterium]|nr:DUF4416 family protein [Candidatus Omnitrophota bacterium]
MGRIEIPKPVKLFTGFITNDIALMEAAQGALEKKFGEIDLRSDCLDFDFTDYYNKEMGAALKRRFIGFKKLAAPEKINRVKMFTNKLEARFSSRGKRKINIDPGYISLSKLVLLTTKDYYHRLYLGKGIYAEVTLYYKDKALKAFEWTYPDFKSPAYMDFFNRLRAVYFSQLNGPD